uniref:hypothetical protein n=1 Tax=Rhodoblastus sp. TaxID=1962975 RepID=UPI003F9CE996
MTGGELGGGSEIGGGHQINTGADVGAEIGGPISGPAEIGGQESGVGFETAEIVDVPAMGADGDLTVLETVDLPDPGGADLIVDGAQAELPTEPSITEPSQEPVDAETVDGNAGDVTGDANSPDRADTRLTENIEAIPAEETNPQPAETADTADGDLTVLETVDIPDPGGADLDGAQAEPPTEPSVEVDSNATSEGGDITEPSQEPVDAETVDGNAGDVT